MSRYAFVLVAVIVALILAACAPTGPIPGSPAEVGKARAECESIPNQALILEPDGSWYCYVVAEPAIGDQDKQIQAAAWGVPGQGNVLALGLMDTLHYIVQILRMAPGTFIMQGPNGEYLLASTMQANTWMWVAMDAKGLPLKSLQDFCGANYCNTMTFTDLIKYLELNKWTYVFPSALPAWIFQTFSTVTAFMTAYGNVLASPMPMFIVIPGGTFHVPGQESIND